MDDTFWIAMALLGIMTVGDPDMIDALIHALMAVK